MSEDAPYQELTASSSSAGELRWEFGKDGKWRVGHTGVVSLLSPGGAIGAQVEQRVASLRFYMPAFDRRRGPCQVHPDGGCGALTLPEPTATIGL